MKVGIDRYVVSVALGCRENGFQLHLLHGPIFAVPGPDLLDGLKDFLIVENLEGLGDVLLPLHDREVSSIPDDRQVVPMVPHDLLDVASPIRKGEHADHLREVGVGSRPDQQPARLTAGLVGIAAQPGPGSLAGTERIRLQLRRLGHSPRLPTCTPDDKVPQVSPGAALVQPQLSLAGEAPFMHEVPPVQIVHVPLRTGPHEAGGYHLVPIEPLSRVQGLPVHQPARLLPPVAVTSPFLHDEPLREAEGTDTPDPLAGVGRFRWRRVEPRRSGVGQIADLALQSRLVDFFEVVDPRPRIQPSDDRGVVGQVDQRPGSVARDDLAAADLSAIPVHLDSSARTVSRLLRKRFTLGSTSLRERLARNFA